MEENKKKEISVGKWLAFAGLLYLMGITIFASVFWDRLRPARPISFIFLTAAVLVTPGLVNKTAKFKLIFISVVVAVVFLSISILDNISLFVVICYPLLIVEFAVITMRLLLFIFEFFVVGLLILIGVIAPAENYFLIWW